MMHNTLAQLRTLKLDGLAAGLEEQLAQASMSAQSFGERLALLVDREMQSGRVFADARGNSCSSVRQASIRSRRWTI